MPEDDGLDGYVEGKWGTESAEHVSLKNTAVLMLMSQGFRRDEIEEEKRVKENPIDIVAEREDGSLVMIECEKRISSPPPTRNEVSYDWEVYKEGHQAFALTFEGLFELVDRAGYVFVPTGAVQTAFQPSDENPLGRWFANSSSIEGILETPKMRRQSHVPSLGRDFSGKVDFADEHSRWRANGVEPDSEQPSRAEIFGVAHLWGDN